MTKRKPKLVHSTEMPADAQPLHTLLPFELQEEFAQRRKIEEHITKRAIGEAEGTGIGGAAGAQWATAYMLMVLDQRLSNVEWYLDQINMRAEEQRRVWEGILPS